MDDQPQQDQAFQSFPTLVSFASPIQTPSSRRLSSSFSQPRPPVLATRNLARISLQGRLINAEEASSARSIGGGLSPDEAVAWQLFTPMERFLIVSVIGVAESESKKNHQIGKLKRAVELRDQVLASMQQKLDDLCDQMNHVKDQSDHTSKNADWEDSGTFGHDEIKCVDCGCWLCDKHRDFLEMSNTATKPSGGGGDGMFQSKLPVMNQAEQEERRMSDLSDWASSVTSSADIQMNALSIDQDMLSLKKDCDEKDATIHELTTLLHSSEVSGSERISELEDIICRKNKIITKLKKDMVILEEKVVQLTRLRRPSYSSASKEETQPFPHMADNLLYDMENSTSPSSSDSDCCSSSKTSKTPFLRTQEIHIQNSSESRLIRNQKSATKKASNTSVKPTDCRSKPHISSNHPPKEIISSVNRKPEILPNRQRGYVLSRIGNNGGGDSTKTRRRVQTDTTPTRKKNSQL